MNKMNDFVYLAQITKATFLVEGMNKVVAVQYIKGLTSLPCVIVKAENEEKDWAINMAKEKNIPVIKDLGLASLLYKSDYYIPEETFAEVSVIMANLMKEKRISL